MKRTIIKIDESICNGCGACIEGCHEGALQLIENKARIISDLFCDGLGACIGECPAGAIELEEREAESYDEVAVMERITPKGERTIVAHLVHLRDHNEIEFFNQGLAYLQGKGITVTIPDAEEKTSCGGGCTGGHDLSIMTVSANTSGSSQLYTIQNATPDSTATNSKPNNITEFVSNIQSPLSQLRQWPIQLHLINPESNYYKGANVVLAADCTAYSCADFHNSFIKGKTIAIACPKLDSNKDIYIEKLKLMIDNSLISTLTVVIMEVPCCRGLLTLARTATSQAKRKVSLKSVTISIRGEVVKEEYV